MGDELDDRTLLWLEAFARADATITSFTAQPGGFLDEVAWTGAVRVRGIRGLRGLRRRFYARIFSWGVRTGLRSNAGGEGITNYKQTVECEKLVVQIALPEVVPTGTRWAQNGATVAGPCRLCESAENSTVIDAGGEPWLALRVEGRISFVHVPTVTWDLGGSVLAADPQLEPLHTGGEREAIGRLVRVYTRSVQHFAGLPALSPAFTKPEAITLDDGAFHEATKWNPWSATPLGAP